MKKFIVLSIVLLMLAGFAITSSASATPPDGKYVDIDIKPGSCPNSINLKSKGVVPVAVLTTDSFDAATVDPSTVELEGVLAVKWAMDDVDGDGDLDLVLHFSTQALVGAGALDANSTLTYLTGYFSGGQFYGQDYVNIVKA